MNSAVRFALHLVIVTVDLSVARSASGHWAVDRFGASPTECSDLHWVFARYPVVHFVEHSGAASFEHSVVVQHWATGLHSADLRLIAATGFVDRSAAVRPIVAYFDFVRSVVGWRWAVAPDFAGHFVAACPVVAHLMPVGFAVLRSVELQTVVVPRERLRPLRLSANPPSPDPAPGRLSARRPGPAYSLRYRRHCASARHLLHSSRRRE